MTIMTHALKGLGFCAVCICIVPANASAQVIYENWNPAACDVTDAATLPLDRPTRLQRVDIWYHWAASEASTRYSVSSNARTIAEGDLVRAECDPYQPAWCVARVELGFDVSPGAYVFRTPRAAICQNAGSGGQGFIRAFGSQ
jgi:hypothetical protein